MKEQIFRAMAIIAVIGIIGTVGGLEHNMMGYGRALLQTGFFMMLAVFCHEQAEAHYRDTRRRRKAGNK